MATERLERPYSQFNFQVSWDGLDENSPQAGFQEASGLGMEITISEYRAGNASTNEPIKINGIVKTPDVTLKRGVLGELDTLYNWLNEVRNGSQTALRNVTIKLMSEDRETVAQTWRLKQARPMKYTGPSLNGKGGDLAIEELVLAAERIEVL
ncbi:MAG: phage tail protein [Candidatus Competibacteraceae bacterium]|nr:phage tail protein [Candidatus Competibacteraceae bacterium]